MASTKTTAKSSGKSAAKGTSKQVSQKAAAPRKSAGKAENGKSRPVKNSGEQPTNNHSSQIDKRSTPMNEQFTKQAQAMFDAAKDVRIPEGFQNFAQETIERSREAYSQMNGAAQVNAKAMEELMIAGQAGAKTISEKMMRNTVANAEAAFDAAQAMSRARSMPELFRLQADFMQQQVAAANAQTKELFDLSTKVAKQTFESMNSVAAKTYDATKR